MSNAIDWAENTLGISSLWEEVKTEQDVLDDLASHLDNASDTKRTLTDKIRIREGDLLIEARGKHPDESQAWMDRHMRGVTHTDAELVTLRYELQAASSTLSGLEYDWEVQKSKVRMLQSRMVQQSGYLNFLAAAKLGEVATALVSALPPIISAAAQTLRTYANPQDKTENKSDGQSSSDAAG